MATELCVDVLSTGGNEDAQEPRNPLLREKRLFEQAVSDYCDSFFSKFPELNPANQIGDYGYWLSRASEQGLSANKEKILFHLLFKRWKKRKNLAVALSDPESYEHKVSFLLYFLVKKLRPIFAAKELDAVIREELVSLLTVDWTWETLEKAHGRSNGLALFLLDALGEFYHLGRYNPFSARWQENNVGRHLAEDALRELRRRLQRGRIGQDDPWWPKEAAED